MNKFLIKDKMVFFYIGTFLMCLWFGVSNYQNEDYFNAMFQFLFLGINIGLLIHYQFAKIYIKRSKVDFELIAAQHKLLMGLHETCQKQAKVMEELKQNNYE